MYKLMDLQAKTALIVPLDDEGEPTGSQTEVDVALLQVGDCLKVLPGSTIPVRTVCCWTLRCKAT